MDVPSPSLKAISGVTPDSTIFNRRLSTAEWVYEQIMTVCPLAIKARTISDKVEVFPVPGSPKSKA
jgi:hypothetical protein